MVIDAGSTPFSRSEPRSSPSVGWKFLPSPTSTRNQVVPDLDQRDVRRRPGHRCGSIHTPKHFLQPVGGSSDRKHRSGHDHVAVAEHADIESSVPERMDAARPPPIWEQRQGEGNRAGQQEETPVQQSRVHHIRS